MLARMSRYTLPLMRAAAGVCTCTRLARGVCTTRPQASQACRAGRRRTGRTTQRGALQPADGAARACSLDTGRLNPETYRLFDKVEKHYGIRIEYTFPDAAETTELVRAKGLFSFYEDGHQECCRVRKARPRRRARMWLSSQPPRACRCQP